MVNGSRNLDLMLGSQRPYFDKTGLGFENEDDEKSSKNSQSKNLPIYIALRRDTHLKNALKKKSKKTEGEKA